MLSFVCLLVFIILVYVPGSTLNVIENNSSGSLVSNNFDKTTLIRTTTPPPSSTLSSSSLLPSSSSSSVFLKEFSTIESIKFNQTKPTLSFYNQPSHNIISKQNHRTLETAKLFEPSTGPNFDIDVSPSLTLTNNKKISRTKQQSTNLPDFLRYSQSTQDKIITTISPLVSPSSLIITKLPTVTTFPNAPIPTFSLLLNSLPTIRTIEFLTTSSNEFKGSSSNRGGRSSIVTKSSFIQPTTKFTNTTTWTGAITTTTSNPTSNPTTNPTIRTRTVKITRKKYSESSSSSSAPTLSSLSSASSLLQDGYINITSQAGTHAYLPCNVRQLVKKPVSWIRVRDGHILTVDQTTFIADQRFQSIYTQNTERWSLQIKYVQTKDAGAYECQVSTEPKTSSLVRLQIVEPKTEMIGEMNRHVKAGSRVTIRCIVSEALEPPLFVNWFFNDKQIFLVNQNGWRTEIDRSTIPAGNYSENHTTIASLIIPSVRKKDSGNYTCNPSNSESITVVLHVLNGEYSASAITSGSRSSTQNIQQQQQQFSKYFIQGIMIMIVICLKASDSNLIS